MARFTDFLSGCVVGGALFATGMLMSRRGEELHLVMLKDDTTATVWAVNRHTGTARFVSSGTIPLDAARQMTREGFERLQQLWNGQVIVSEHGPSARK